MTKLYLNDLKILKKSRIMLDDPVFEYQGYSFDFRP